MGKHDRSLVDAVLAGDADAYRALVEQEASTVVRLCSAILRDQDEAQDVAQDAFVQAYRALVTFRGDGSFGAWIGRIATRMAVARAVTRQGRRERPLLDVEPTMADEHANPERQLARSQQAHAVRMAISRLPREQQQVVAMRFFDDMPLDQIAAATGAPLGTVKSRLHRALTSLRGHDDLRPSS